MTYKFRFFFDAGSGVCFWPGNDSARERYGYAPDHWELPLSENTKRWLTYLLAWYDTSLDWSDPGDPNDYWSADERSRFQTAVANGLKLVRDELPALEYEIVDETGRQNE